MTAPKLMCAACGEVEIGIFCPVCPACFEAMGGHAVRVIRNEISAAIVEAADKEICAGVIVSEFALRFNNQGAFAAINAARDWCDERGVSYGSMQRDCPIGLIVGDAQISKWRGMTAKEKDQLEGTIDGEMRDGPVTLRLKSCAIAKLSGGVA